MPRLGAGIAVALVACGGPGPPPPIEFSHRLHAGTYEIACVYCHTGADRSEVARLPALRTCLDCHDGLKEPVPGLATIRRALDEGRSLSWVRVHDLPEHVRFDHAAHARAGVQCSSCHGEVATMDRVRQVKSLSMGWCLDCHRDSSVLRVEGEAAVLLRGREPRAGALAIGRPTIPRSVDRPSTDCAACHR